MNFEDLNEIAAILNDQSISPEDRYVIADPETLAQWMYEAGAQERGPAWHQIGEVTKSVWRERVAAIVPDGVPPW